MKNTEKISPSEKIIEKLKEEKILEKLKEEKILEKIVYSDFVEICLEFVEYFIFPLSDRDLSSYVSYSRGFLRGKIDENKFINIKMKLSKII